jgi:hypothetical protein
MLKKLNTQKRAGEVAQGVGPEFKPQHHKNPKTPAGVQRQSSSEYGVLSTVHHPCVETEGTLPGPEWYECGHITRTSLLFACLQMGFVPESSFEFPQVPKMRQGFNAKGLLGS